MKVIYLDHIASSTDSDYDGVSGETVTVTVNDDDIPALPSGRPRWHSPRVGSAGQYRVRLNALPTTSVTIDIEETDDAITAAPTSLTFTISTTWNQEKTVRVTPDQDDDTNSETSITITHTVDHNKRKRISSASALTA